MSDLLVTHARLITGEPGGGAVDDGWLLARGGIVEAVGSGPAPTAPGVERLDVAGAFVAPGFVSSHSHLFTSGARGVGADEELYGWLGHLAAAAMCHGPDEVYWLTLFGALDFLARGVTTAYDFADASERHAFDDRFQLTGESDLRPVDYQLRQLDAKVDAGLRFVNSVFLDDAFGTDEEIIERFGAVVAHAGRQPAGLCLGMAVSGGLQWSERDDCAALELAVMRRFGVINQAHILETAVDRDAQRDKVTPYLDPEMISAGLLFGHFVHHTDAMLETVGAAGGGVSWQPAANGRLASGTLDVPALRAHGIRVGIGMDDQACNDSSDPWQNMRAGLYGVRAARSDPRALSAAEALHLHTLGAAELIGAADRVGSLSPGKFADFLVVDPRRPDLGPLRDPIAGYVLACGQRNLRAVYVGAVPVARDGLPLHPAAQEAADIVHALATPR